MAYSKTSPLALATQLAIGAGVTGSLYALLFRGTGAQHAQEAKKEDVLKELEAEIASHTSGTIWGLGQRAPGTPPPAPNTPSSTSRPGS